MTYKLFFWGILSSFILLACNNNPLDISPRKKDLKIKFINLDSIFYNTEEYQLTQKVKETKIYPDEIIAYELGHCLQIGQLEDSSTPQRIKTFTTDKFIQRVEKRIQQKFKNLTTIKENILDGFLHLNHHLPSSKLPKNIIFLNSLFASNVFCTENEIGIGLERYLGDKTDVIQELPPHEFYDWIKEGMQSIYLERDVLTAWILTHIVSESKSNTADAIVTWGKIIYLTEAAFPNQSKNIIIRYSPKDYQWALDNEYAFWKYLVDEKLLFLENDRDQTNFLNDAPFTVGLPEKGPDRLGQFLGWRIVQDYMEANPETTLEKLIKLPYTEILQEYEVN